MPICGIKKSGLLYQKAACLVAGVGFSHGDALGRTYVLRIMSPASYPYVGKPAHENIIRFQLPLVMNEEQPRECLSIISKTVLEFENVAV